MDVAFVTDAGACYHIWALECLHGRGLKYIHTRRAIYVKYMDARLPEYGRCLPLCIVHVIYADVSSFLSHFLTYQTHEGHQLT